MGRVEGKVVFITGVARGQGRAHALRLAEEGADIIGVDICSDIETNGYPLSTEADLDETRRAIENLDRRAVLRKADVRDPAALQQIVDEGVAELGHLDAVIAQAGICPLGAQAPQAFLDSANVLLGGVMNAVTAAMPHLSAGASVVCTGSLAAMITGGTDNPAHGAGGIGYSWAKRTVASFVNDLALVCAPSDIRVNAIHPTNCNTKMLQSDPMYRSFRPDLENPTREDVEPAFHAMTALPVPYVEPEEIASMSLFLISEESRHITGMQMRVDAGGFVKLRPATLPF